MIFTEIENNPSTIHQHHNKSKVQEVLKLIQAEFDRYQPNMVQANNIQYSKVLLKFFLYILVQNNFVNMQYFVIFGFRDIE